VACGSAALFCPSESASVSAVSSGFYTTPQTVDTITVRENQTPCPSGFACVGGIKSACISGSTYQLEPSKSSCLTCSICPAGTFKTSDCTPTTDTVCEPCPPGSACLEGLKTICVLGSYQPEPSKSSCLTCSICPAGTYSSSYCTRTTDSVCETCEKSSASMGGATFCAQCDGEGQYSATEGASVCSVAPAGTRPLTDRTGTVTCPKNTFSIGAKDFCVPCPGGGHSVPGSSACEQCTAGKYYKETGNKCEACPFGKYTSTGETNVDDCKGCKPGFVSKEAEGAAFCSPCPSGSVFNTEQTACILCPPGKFSGIAATVCQDCDIGKYAQGTSNEDCTK